jgi:hypothetical protein
MNLSFPFPFPFPFLVLYHARVHVYCPFLVKACLAHEMGYLHHH